MQNITKSNSRVTSKESPNCNTPIYEDLFAVRKELRIRRKHMLRSFVSLCKYTCKNGSVDENLILQLSNYLTDRTVYFLSENSNDPSLICRFYALSLYAISSGKVGDESVDDVIQLASCLVRSKDVFITVMKNLLPENMIGELFYFTDNIGTSFDTPIFEDAVLGAICVFLGVLKDPLAHQEDAFRRKE